MLRDLFMTRKSATTSTPAKKTSTPSPTTSDTVLGTGTVIEGNITSEGNLRIDGTVNGDISAEGDILIDKNGRVEGNLKGKAVTIGGQTRGDVDGTRISVLKSGRVWGDLTTTSLYTEEGGFIQGVITMQDERAKEKSSDSLPPELEEQIVEAISKKPASKKPASKSSNKK